jgi:RNA polymerase sigma-70 factor (ECF subfamily)
MAPMAGASLSSYLPGPEPPFEPDSALRRELLRRLHAAELATPRVVADARGFVQKLAARLVTVTAPLAELEQLHVEDMYLAWALSRADAAALRRFEGEFLSKLATQIKGAAAEAGELEQQVRTRLLLSSGDQPPRIEQYSGRGPFGGWLRMIATRCVLDLQRARNSGQQLRELDSPTLATDPELDYLKLRHAGDFKVVLEQALARLDARQVTLLKLAFVEQLAPSAIGVMYGVSARTVQRWLVDLREELLKTTREGLRARLSLSPSELDSLLGLVDSQLQVSLYRVLNLAPPNDASR